MRMAARCFITVQRRSSAPSTRPAANSTASSVTPSADHSSYPQIPRTRQKKGANKQVRYHRVPEMWRRGEKLEYLVSGKVPCRTLIPDAKHTWLVPAHGDEYGGLLAIKSMFALQSLGLNTNRDEVVQPCAP